MSKNHSRTVSIDTPNHSSRGRTPEGEPNPVDVYVGSRLRLRRTVLNLSQEKLAALAGLTFQQIQKYEHGMNRIGASRLYDFAQILDVPVSFFFAEMPEEVAQRSPRRYSGVSCCESDVPQLPEDPAHSAEIQSLIRAYSRITNREAARALLALSEKMAPLAACIDKKTDMA
ncbi:MAG: helix-turn-helix domain-containing protein [Alphaproteobacteria bacterium]|nr:helix-turn-helix domain-containing protein [Alphaproteobacteria bacterium]HIV08420.1 helix-turn-helix domain-containing protein [Candidatus Scatocola faecigallinarum]